MMREYARAARTASAAAAGAGADAATCPACGSRLVTPAQARVGRALVEGLRNPTVVRSTAARETFGSSRCRSTTAVVKAHRRGSAGASQARHAHGRRRRAAAQAFAPIRRIGGETGWYLAMCSGRLRGWLDRWLGGGAGWPRTARPRCVCRRRRIDGWTRRGLRAGSPLRLSAGLKLPGRGWLEFGVDAARRRRAVDDLSDGDVRPAGLDGTRLLVCDAAAPCAYLPRSAAADRAARVHEAARTQPSTFTYCSIIGAPAAEVFRWHEQPGALAALTPRRWCGSKSKRAGSATAGESRCRLASVRHASAG